MANNKPPDGRKPVAYLDQDFLNSPDARAIRLLAEYLEPLAVFRREKIRDTVVFFGAVWHCAMPNRSQQDRSAILIQYLPKWVKPMENLPAALSSSFVERASADVRQLLGLNYPYPEVLDEARSGNAVGRMKGMR